MFLKSGYTASMQEYFDSSEKVRFYTGLPSYDVLLIVFQHVAPHVPRRAKVLDSFQEFVMVLIKLRLNVPFQDLAYRFNISLSSVSRIFNSCITVMDARLSGASSTGPIENDGKPCPRASSIHLAVK